VLLSVAKLLQTFEQLLCAVVAAVVVAVDVDD
jgi:hypothetical protein